MRYASTLRCFGQLLEGMELKALEIKTHNDDYILQAWNKGTSMTMDLDKIFTPDDVQQLEVDGRAKRKPFSGPPNMLSLPQVLRLAGNYVDRQRLLELKPDAGWYPPSIFFQGMKFMLFGDPSLALGPARSAR